MTANVPSTEGYGDIGEIWIIEETKRVSDGPKTSVASSFTRVQCDETRLIN